MVDHEESSTIYEETSAIHEEASVNSSASSAPVAASPIIIQVGERRFATTKDTLVGESTFFASLLSGRWDNAQQDGSYFVDADPTLFEHVLTYLRRGVFPVFFDSVNGHNLRLYTTLLEEARYFQIRKLVKWLENQTYLMAVEVKYIPEVVEGEDGLLHTDVTNAQLFHFPTWATRQIYLCPRRIPVHRGKPEACGRACMNAQEGEDVKYEEEQFLKTLVIRKTVRLDEELVRGEEQQEVLADRSLFLGRWGGGDSTC